jgi:hypothetical protein
MKHSRLTRQCMNTRDLPASDASAIFGRMLREAFFDAFRTRARLSFRARECCICASA